MSAFVVNDETINSAVAWLATSTAARELIRNATGFQLETAEGREQLAKAMFDLNVNAVDQRYGVGQAAGFRPLNFAYAVVEFTPAQALKNLRCWSYQCAEGDVPETSALYKVVEVISELPENNRMAKTSAYDRANWG